MIRTTVVLFNSLWECPQYEQVIHLSFLVIILTQGRFVLRLKNHTKNVYVAHMDWYKATDVAAMYVEAVYVVKRKRDYVYGSQYQKVISKLKIKRGKITDKPG